MGRNEKWYAIKEKCAGVVLQLYINKLENLNEEDSFLGKNKNYRILTEEVI